MLKTTPNSFSVPIRTNDKIFATHGANQAKKLGRYRKEISLGMFEKISLYEEPSISPSPLTDKIVETNQLTAAESILADPVPSEHDKRSSLSLCVLIIEDDDTAASSTLLANASKLIDAAQASRKAAEKYAKHPSSPGPMIAGDSTDSGGSTPRDDSGAPTTYTDAANRFAALADESE